MSWSIFLHVNSEDEVLKRNSVSNFSGHAFVFLLLNKEIKTPTKVISYRITVGLGLLIYPATFIDLYVQKGIPFLIAYAYLIVYTS